MFELLQYTPTTPKVCAIPLLMVPPQINRHYILDLSPGRSLVEFAVSQGIQVFMVVWRNPSSQRGDGKWGWTTTSPRRNEPSRRSRRSRIPTS
jgi:polyhydroxyalkanoate synthase